MPNYNNGPYLKEAINSILNQTFSDFEFIIVDDGSIDNSIEIINSYSDLRIKLIVKDTNSGIVDALNIGIESAHAEFLVRMDGDDISSPDRIEKLVKFLHQNPEIGICSSAIQNFGLSDDTWLFEPNPLVNRAHLLFGLGIGHASSIFRMSLFKDNTIRYRNKYPYVEDYKLFTELNLLTHFSSIPDVLYQYRRLPHTSTISNKNTMRERIGLIHAEVLSELLNRPPTNNELHLHYNFYRGIYDKPLIEYYAWAKTLQKSNQNQKIFPIKELKIVIEQKLEKIKFKALDVAYSNIWEIIKYDGKPRLNYFRYLAGKLFKS